MTSHQSNISRDFSLQLSKRLEDSDLAVIGLTGIGPMRKISVLNWFLSYWPNESFYIVLTDLIILSDNWTFSLLLVPLIKSGSLN
jgi:hypothetical protein